MDATFAACSDIDMRREAFHLRPVTTKAGRDKLALSCGSTHICDISIYTKRDDEIARHIVRAANSHAALVSALEQARSLIGVMFGDGPNAVIPETVLAPLGVDIKIGDIMRNVNAALKLSQEA